jgi:tripartite ATP-independent transporter DctP family solute receptor
MAVSRRIFSGGVAAGAFALAASRPLRAQTPRFVFKCGSDVPLSHSINIRLKEASDRIRTDTGGQVELQIFPNNQMGSDTDMLSQLRSGALELLSLAGTILATLVPAASLNSVGFAFKDYPMVWKGMDGPVGGYIREQIGKSGIVVMDKIWDNGFRNITTRPKPILSAEDLRDFKLRVPVSPMLLSVFKSLGASPISINFSELYSALQTRIVDGQENALTLIYTAKMYEVQKYCALTRHVWDGYWMLANRRIWGTLPPDLAVIVAKHLDRSALDQRRDSEAADKTLQADLTKQGMVFNEPDTAAFREQLRVSGFYRDWRAKFGEAAWAHLEEVTGQLA